MTLENIVGNGAFAHDEQMLHFPQYFQNHSKIGIFVSIRYSSFSSDDFIWDESKTSILGKGLTLYAILRLIHNQRI